MPSERVSVRVELVLQATMATSWSAREDMALLEVVVDGEGVGEVVVLAGMV